MRLTVATLLYLACSVLMTHDTADLQGRWLSVVMDGLLIVMY